MVDGNVPILIFFAKTNKGMRARGYGESVQIDTSVRYVISAPERDYSENDNVNNDSDKHG
jgi:hypothetical protein